MAKVRIRYKNQEKDIIKEETIATGGDTAFILDDINNSINEDGDWGDVPVGTKSIHIKIYTDF